MFERELERYYYNAPFDTVINYEGYDLEQALLFSYYKRNNSIWVHKNIFHKNLKNLCKPALKEAYSNYDTINVISEDLIEPTSKISGRDDIQVANDFNN